ncbi:hypothetical protein HGRIS_011299 [Hohenbuehelia grisea]|uniref:Cytochrome P450 n=1 Tax=Hohenbuehelia grisea TaxID=104357 RepID=A0ABR3JWK8_9AGAR
MLWKLVLSFAGLWLVKYAAETLLAVRKARQAIRDCPGGEILWTHPFRTFSIILGGNFPFPGHMGYYFAKFSIYAQYGSTCLSSIVFSDGTPLFWLADADAIKVVTTERLIFQKDVEAYETLNIYGPNMVGTEGSDWKRHRGVAKPAFNEANNAYVWTETIRIVNQWFDQIDSNAKEETTGGALVNLVTDLTQITLLVISSAGFGRKTSLSEDSKTEPPPGHTVAFRPAVLSAIDHLFVKILTPNWIYDLSEFIFIPFMSKALKDTRESFDALRRHMLDVISQARAWVASGKVEKMDAALLRNLVEANMSQESDYKSLTDEELLSNTFTFLLAGHETSAHTLSYAITLLALYPEIQQKVFEEAFKLWPNGVPEVAQSSAYKESMPQLEYATATFHETLRLFPPVSRLGKPVHTDTTLKARRFIPEPSGKFSSVPKSEEFEVTIPVGSAVLIDVFAVQRNPLHWGVDADEFKPEHFIDTETYRWPRDAFLAFSGGARSCIGQRFAVTESTCILASLVRRYEILVPDDVKHLSFEKQKDILLDTTPRVTLTPNNARVVLRKRV